MCLYLSNKHQDWLIAAIILFYFGSYFIFYSLLLFGADLAAGTAHGAPTVATAATDHTTPASNKK